MTDQRFFTAPPVGDAVTDKESGLVTLPWMIFFNALFSGDPGQAWTPSFTGLTEVGGAVTVTGKSFQLSQSLVLFSASIVPATGGNSSAVAGTTYINNFPFTAAGDGICFAVSGNLGSNSGMVSATDNRIYVPAWTTVTVPLTIIGIVEAN